MNKTIWTVTVVSLQNDKMEDRWPRTWGYEFTREEAIATLQKTNTECGYYTHAVIEEMTPGYSASAETELWFKWVGSTDLSGEGAWTPCEKPESECRTCNYSMG